MSIEVLITFVLYLALLLGIGLYFYRRSANIEDYLIGGRSMGPWVTAISAQASDMSGWLLMGLPGAMYLGGMKNVWIAVGLFIGTVLNWGFISSRLRVYTEETGAITLPTFFEKRFKDPTGLLRTVSAIIILIFFTIYTSSGLVAAGKLFESIFDINYKLAVIVGGLVIVLYTFLGGFLAVCWTDLLQGMLMVIAVVAVPLIAFLHVGRFDAIKDAMLAKQLSISFIPRDTNWPVIAIISAAAWGLGYFGQPHILVRFMSVSSIGKLKRSMAIAIVWVFVSLSGAVAAGLIGIAMFDGLADGEQEKVFIYMITRLLNPWLAGIMLAAILSAIMSTIDSQLLVSSSALTEDFYRKLFNADSSLKKTMLVGRICVLVIALIALFLALNPNDTILGIVAYAWGGFGAAFGPLIICALFSRGTTWLSALIGMVTGAVVLIVCKQMGLGELMYEIVPGFIANFLAIFIVNRFVKQDNALVHRTYDRVLERLKTGRVQ